MRPFDVAEKNALLYREGYAAAIVPLFLEEENGAKQRLSRSSIMQNATHHRGRRHSTPGPQDYGRPGVIIRRGIEFSSGPADKLLPFSFRQHGRTVACLSSPRNH